MVYELSSLTAPHAIAVRLTDGTAARLHARRRAGALASKEPERNYPAPPYPTTDGKIDRH